MFDCLAPILWQFKASISLFSKTSSQYFRSLLTVKTWLHIKQKKTIQQLKTFLTTFLPHIYSRSKVTQLIYRVNTLHVGSLFKVYEYAVGVPGPAELLWKWGWKLLFLSIYSNFKISKKVGGWSPLPCPSPSAGPAYTDFLSRHLPTRLLRPC